MYNTLISAKVYTTRFSFLSKTHTTQFRWKIYWHDRIKIQFQTNGKELTAKTLMLEKLVRVLHPINWTSVYLWKTFLVLFALISGDCLVGFGPRLSYELMSYMLKTKWQKGNFDCNCVALGHLNVRWSDMCVRNTWWRNLCRVDVTQTCQKPIFWLFDPIVFCWSSPYVFD